MGESATDTAFETGRFAVHTTVMLVRKYVVPSPKHTVELIGVFLSTTLLTALGAVITAPNQLGVTSLTAETITGVVLLFALGVATLYKLTTIHSHLS